MLVSEGATSCASLLRFQFTACEPKERDGRQSLKRYFCNVAVFCAALWFDAKEFLQGVSAERKQLKQKRREFLFVCICLQPSVWIQVPFFFLPTGPRRYRCSAWRRGVSVPSCPPLMEAGLSQPCLKYPKLFLKNMQTYF